MRGQFLLLVFLLLGVGVGEAQAACNGGASVQVAVCANREEAYAGAQARLDWVVANVAGKLPCPILLNEYPAYNPPRYQVNAKTGETGTCGNQGRREWPVGQDCPVGEVWNEGTKTCDAPNQCASAPPKQNLGVVGSVSVCDGGCEYVRDTPPLEKNPADVCMGPLSNRYCGATNWSPTGQQCDAGDPPPLDHDPNKDTCQSIPGSAYSECVKPDGEHCVTSPAGRSLCWQNGETGPRATNDGRDGADRQKAPGIPTAPTNMKDPTPGPSVTTEINNNTYNTTVFSGTGANPGQGPGTGAPNDGDGDGEEDEGDDGTVSGGGTCAAAPACEGNPIECYHAAEAWRLRCDAANDPETADLLGALAGYHEEEAADMNPFLGTDGQGDLDSHREVKEIDFAELDDSGFLGGGGSCPSSNPVSVRGVSLPIDMSKFCSLLSNVGQIVLALAYLVAIRIIATGGK